MEERTLEMVEEVVESADVVKCNSGNGKCLAVVITAGVTLAAIAIGRKVIKTLKNKKNQTEQQEVADEDFDEVIDEDLDSEEE